MRLLFVHGWGFHAGVWDDVAARLGRFDPGFLDLGFVRHGPRGVSSFSEDMVCVGHSFGVLWLLKHGPRPMCGLVSIAGFDCFSSFADLAVVEAMKQGLTREPVAQMQAFWRSCGAGAFGEREDLDVATLKAGLDWLARWDEREAHAALDCPVLALASEDDAIVPIAASRVMWAEDDLRTCPGGGHVLPLSRPEWCAEEIEGFLDGLES